MLPFYTNMPNSLRIQAVSHRIGVSVATLRAWERRYGIPAPSRTSSRYRVYAEAEVAAACAMRDLVRGGMAPGEAARQLLAQRDSAPVVAVVDPYEAAVERIVAAAMRCDPDAVGHGVDLAMCLGRATAIFDRVLGPTMHAVGDLWHSGTLTVCQEHIVSQAVLGAVVRLVRLVQPERGRRVVLAGFADEEHVLGLYGVALHFAGWGYRSVMLGPRTPPEAIRDAVSATAPDVVGLSVSVGGAPGKLTELVQDYAAACGDTAWVVGGSGAAAIATVVEHLGGIVAPAQLDDLRPVLRRRLRGHRAAE